MRIERQIHHYGSGLNAIPLISHFRADPTDIYILRVGYAGLSGPLSNIDQGGVRSSLIPFFRGHFEVGRLLGRLWSQFCRTRD